MALINKNDIENELQLSLSDGYTDDIILSLADTAEDWLKLCTKRTSFSGSAANLATKYVLFKTIDRLLTTNPDLVKTDISKISENGASLDFASTGRTLKDYASEAEAILEQLTIKIPVYPCTYTNESTFYRNISDY